MPHQIQWDNIAKTVVLQQYETGATKDDLYQLAQKSAEMLKSVSHKVHLIIDESNIRLMLNTTDVKFLESKVPPNQGVVVMIVPKGTQKYKEIIQAMSRPFAPKAFGEPYFTVSVESARQLLKEQFEVEYP
jgi:hypothetical protein